MEVTDPRIRSLLRQAKKTAEAGKRGAAQQLYEQIVEEAPELVEAWLGLAEVAAEPRTRREAYKRVLALEPENATARQELQLVDDVDGALREDVEATENGQDGVPLVEEHVDAETPQDRQVDTGGQLTQAAAITMDQMAQAQERENVNVAAARKPEVEEVVLYCYRHPDRETRLRCYSCGRPICMRCARHTPVGYRCPQCIREAQDVYFSANILDYVLAGTVSLILAALAGRYIVQPLGFFVFFIAPVVGTLIGRVAFRVARRHHGRYLPRVVGTMVAVGGLLPTLLPLLIVLLTSPASIAGLGLNIIWPVIFVLLATGAAYYQVK